MSIAILPFDGAQDLRLEILRRAPLFSGLDDATLMAVGGVKVCRNVDPLVSSNFSTPGYRMSLSISRVLLLLIVACMAALASDVRAQENRVALVIGNAAYVNADPLRNPLNDAREMARVLRAAGFDVVARENATRRTLIEALNEFASKVTPGGVGLFYFAGHGFQVRGANYLVPVDAVLSSEYDVKYETLDINDVLARLDEARVRLSLVILDACRDNPFARRFRSTSSRGLAQIDAPRGTVIAYATAPGETAADGDGANGVYTAELLKAIAAPGLKLEDVFKRTIDGVARASGNRQTPWMSSSFRGDFYFHPVAAVPPPPPPVAVAPPSPPSPTSPEALELAAWNAIAGSDYPALFEAYLQRFPNGIYAGIARARLEQLKALQTAAAAQRQAEEDARRKAAADEEARRKADAEAKRLAADEARRKVNVDAEAKRLAADEARRKADADADAKRAAERIEQALQLTEAQRRRVQGGLTIKGFDTGGTDGAFGPRTRAMIAAYQLSLSTEPTGYLNPVQFAALLRDTEQAWTRLEQERQKTEDQRKEDQRKAAASVPPVPPAPGVAPQPQPQAQPQPQPQAPVAGVARNGAWKITGSCPEVTFTTFVVSGTQVTAYVKLHQHDANAWRAPIIAPVSGALQPDGGFSLAYGDTVTVSGTISAAAITGTVLLRGINKRCSLVGQR